MVHLTILSGKKAGTEMVARHFPFRVGRSSSCELPIDDPGVWEKHFEINPSGSDGFILLAGPETSVVIDGKTVQEAPLRNGDVIQIGLAKILFGLSPTRQKRLAVREWLTWAALTALCCGQLALIYKLLQS